MINVTNYRFAAIVRTQGRRLKLLAEALQSLSFQKPLCTAIVVAHSSSEYIEDIKCVCREIDLEHVVLHAHEKDRKRGYPLNVGLSHCYETQLFDALFFLDDDDIVYPFFTRIMSQAMTATEADVIYAQCNKRHFLKPTELAYSMRHISHLFIENFIPINSYIVRMAKLQKYRIFFEETLEYTEDWHFLLRMIEHGFRFDFILNTVSEFRLISDGNTTIKRDMYGWKRDSIRIREYINKTMFLMSGPCLAHSVMPAISNIDFSVRQAEIDPRAVILWKTLHRYWHKIPQQIRKPLVWLYHQYYSRLRA